MVSESERDEPKAGRRTDGDRQRRQTLNDAANGIERFRVVIYVCTALNADASIPIGKCRQYAQAFGWDVVAEIEERDTLRRPAQREGLTRAIERIEQRQAGAVLTPWPSMVSTSPEEYHEVARLIEKWGGFLHVMDGAKAQAGTRQ
ncbi:hypothetical protein [Streptomyces sp. NPDC051014]|uniref:hypothetical protein n=1 Tax=Streptomyces sp. NPDC051014 TaxID=3155751 RepID=UPI00340DD2C9